MSDRQKILKILNVAVLKDGQNPPLTIYMW